VEGFRVTKKCKYRLFSGLIAMLLVTGLLRARAQSEAPTTQAAPPAGAYQPKFSGDPAHSESEAQALAYMRVALRAEHTYKQKHGKYTTSLAQLVGTGSFTKRSVAVDRGDYTVGFRPHKERNSDEEGFVLTMTPKHMDAEHRSFYAEEDGVIHGDDQKPAGADSPKLK